MERTQKTFSKTGEEIFQIQVHLHLAIFTLVIKATTT